MDNLKVLKLNKNYLICRKTKKIYSLNSKRFLTSYYDENNREKVTILDDKLFAKSYYVNDLYNETFNKTKQNEFIKIMNLMVKKKHLKN